MRTWQGLGWGGVNVGEFCSKWVGPGWLRRVGQGGRKKEGPLVAEGEELRDHEIKDALATSGLAKQSFF